MLLVPKIWQKQDRCVLLPLIFSSSVSIHVRLSLSETFLYRCLFFANLLCPFPHSSVIMTFKAFLVLLRCSKAIWQWHSASLCVNLTGNVMGTQFKAFSPRPIWCLLGRKHVPQFSSKQCQRSHSGVLRAGRWDDARVCVSFACECVYLSLIESAEEGLTIAPLWIDSSSDDTEMRWTKMYCTNTVWQSAIKLTVTGA